MKVFACDIQQAMLDIVKRKKEKMGISNIVFIESGEGKIGVDEKLDFALCFGLVHETGNAADFFRQLSAVIKPGGKVLFVESASQVSENEFDKSVGFALAAGFVKEGKREVNYSRAVVLKK